MIVHILRRVWHLDVGLLLPKIEGDFKGWTVRPVMRSTSWVQNVVKQFGPYLSENKQVIKNVAFSTKGPSKIDFGCENYECFCIDIKEARSVL